MYHVPGNVKLDTWNVYVNGHLQLGNKIQPWAATLCLFSSLNHCTSVPKKIHTYIYIYIDNEIIIWKKKLCNNTLKPRVWKAPRVVAWCFGSTTSVKPLATWNLHCHHWGCDGNRGAVVSTSASESFGKFTLEVILSWVYVLRFP